MFIFFFLFSYHFAGLVFVPFPNKYRYVVILLDPEPIFYVCCHGDAKRSIIVLVSSFILNKIRFIVYHFTFPSNMLIDKRFKLKLSCEKRLTLVFIDFN